MVGHFRLPVWDIEGVPPRGLYLLCERVLDAKETGAGGGLCRLSGARGGQRLFRAGWSGERFASPPPPFSSGLLWNMAISSPFPASGFSAEIQVVWRLLPSSLVHCPALTPAAFSLSSFELRLPCPFKSAWVPLRAFTGLARRHLVLESLLLPTRAALSPPTSRMDVPLLSRPRNLPALRQPGTSKERASGRRGLCAPIGSRWQPIRAVRESAVREKENPETDVRNGVRQGVGENGIPGEEGGGYL